MVKYIVKEILDENVFSKLNENEIEPSTGWVLSHIVNLENKRNFCQNKGCGKVIKYEYHIFHKKCGYKIVGSTCVNYLTDEEKLLGKKVIGYFKKINTIFEKSEQDLTKNKTSFLCISHKKNLVKIYENHKGFHTIKKKGRNLDFGNKFTYKNKSFYLVKKLAIIALIGISTENESDKEILRNIYISFLNSE